MTMQKKKHNDKFGVQELLNFEAAKNKDLLQHESFHHLPLSGQNEFDTMSCTSLVPHARTPTPLQKTHFMRDIK